MKAIRYILLLCICFIFTLSNFAQETNTTEPTDKAKQDLVAFTQELLNNNEIVLPLEINSLIGDTTNTSYKAEPIWENLQYNLSNKKTCLILPTCATTPNGTINSQLEIIYKGSDKYTCLVKTFLANPKSLENAFSGVILESDINGTFYKGKIYSNGIITGEVEGEEQNKSAIWKAKRSDNQIVSVYNYQLKQKAKKEFKKNREEKNIHWGYNYKDEKFIYPQNNSRN